jgi:hypothetical protein
MAWGTPVDRLFSQKTFFYAFVGIIVTTTALTLLSDSPIGNTNFKKAVAVDHSSHGGFLQYLNSFHRPKELVHHRSQEMVTTGQMNGKDADW